MINKAFKSFNFAFAKKEKKALQPVTSAGQGSYYF